MINFIVNILSVPPLRYPEKWKPAFLAMQLGFIAGGVGLIGRDFLFYLTIQNWEPLVLSELFFASFIAFGFILHTLGFAKFGVILSCIAGVGSATAFIFLIGWNSFFHLWYINLAILIIAVPLDIRLKAFLALVFISIYSYMFISFSEMEPLYKINDLTESIIGVSNIVGSLLVLGLPMGMYSIFLEQERNKSEKLLHNIMPKSIAEKLKNNIKTISMDNPEISVLFADIVSFTEMSEKISSEKIVGFLNDMFSQFDDLTETYGVEKIKTIGDSYMVVSGMPVQREDHALTLFNLAKEMIKISAQFKDHNGNPIKLRIGINSGPAISGVIGKSKFAFDVWGDTINTAARLESYGTPDCIHMSKNTFDLVNYKDSNIERKTIQIRGKGLMDTVLVHT
ncbi:MAG: adenylate cyclase [Alphaproteobacteria bacterium]|jgi:class 3 adenylate cyclase|nr:MAG: adenylate cyclase [Alphaproteobacteria bacterium]